MDADDIVSEIEESIEWFCDKAVIHPPVDKKAKEDVMKRMIQIGWLRQSEMETYLELTKED